MRSAIAQHYDIAWPREAVRDETACTVLARPARARQWTARRKEFFRETIKARARLIEQGLRSWSDARGSQAQEKKGERLKMGK